MRRKEFPKGFFTKPRKHAMKDTFLDLCELHEWVAFCMWAGPQSKATDACKRIDEIAKDHPILNFFAMILHPYFGFPPRRK